MRAPSVAVLALLLCLAVALPPERADAAVYWTRVFGGLTSPIEVTHAGDGSNRVFIVQQGGKILIAKAGVVQPTAFLDLTDLISAGGERGLLGVAFHPQYATNRQFYVNYTRSGDGATVIARYTANAGNADVADAASATILLTIAQPFSNHNGGALKFGPDGYLYIGMGDGGDANDPGGRAQDTTTLLGKILRIDVNNGSPYAIPPTNPFPTGVGGRAEIFAIGMRNPWRFSFDRANGDFWIGDVGQGAQEEIDRLAVGTGAGANFGWRVMEGNQCTGLTGPVACNAPSLTAPVIAYTHSVGCSVTGGYVYRGAATPDLVGKYLYGDYCSGRLWAATGSGAGPWVPAELSATGFNVSTFGEDEAGELYFANYATGEVFQFVGTPAALPQLTLNTKFVSFGDVNVGSTSGTKSVNVTNTGGGTLSITALTPGGANGGEFKRSGTCAVGTALAAGQGCTVSYQFAPQTSGNRSANLAVTTNGGAATFNLGGNGIGAASPVLGAGTTALAFGSINVGSSSATQSFNVTNTGGGTLTLSALTAGGTNPGDFARTGTCTVGTALAAAQSCTVIYQFTPTAAGARSASLVIASNGGSAPITLGGTGVAAATPVLGVGANVLAFGSVSVGSSSAVQSFNLTNTGGGTLTLSALTAGGTNPGDFARSGTCAAGTALAAAQSCTVTYQFTPIAAGARSASLAIASNGGNATVTLGGTGLSVTPVLGVGATALGFGSVNLGTSSGTQTFNVTNTGAGTLTLASLTPGGTNPGDFTQGGTCANGAVLAAAQGCTVSFQFTPAAAGARSANLAIASNGGNATVALSGTGVSVGAVFAVTPGALDFGALEVGTTSTAQALTVSNAGTANLTLGAFSLAGAHPGDFVLTGTCAVGLTLAPTASCTVSLRFHPLVAGARSAVVSFVHNAPGSPATVTLAGTGGTTPVVTDVIEFYHAGFDHYFISALPADIAALDSGTFKGWVRTGRTFHAITATPGATPVCRFYLPPIFGDSHFYSASPAECLEVLARFPGFVYESPNVMYVYLPDPITGACPASTVPVYRVWNARADTNHRYTTDSALRDAFVALGYVAEGYGPDVVAMCSPQ